MNKYHLTLCATFASALVACATTETSGEASEAAATAPTAQTSNAQEERRRGRNRGAHSRTAFFNSYDKNEDGSVTRSEFTGVRDQGYARRDANKDGMVSPDEYVGEYEQRLDAQLADQRDRQLKQAYVRFGSLDKNDDGQMTREEFAESGTRMFGRLDDNDDGVIDGEDETERY